MCNGYLVTFITPLQSQATPSWQSDGVERKRKVKCKEVCILLHWQATNQVIFALNTYKTVPIEKYLGKTRQICDRLAFLSNINKNALLQIKLPYKSFFNLYAF